MTALTEYHARRYWRAMRTKAEARQREQICDIGYAQAAVELRMLIEGPDVPACIKRRAIDAFNGRPSCSGATGEG